MTDATLFQRLLVKTLDGTLQWVPTRQDGGEAPMKVLEARRGDMTITLDLDLVDGEDFHGWMIWWELFEEEHFMPGSGRVCRDPAADDALKALWAAAERGVVWDDVPLG